MRTWDRNNKYRKWIMLCPLALGIPWGCSGSGGSAGGGGGTTTGEDQITYNEDPADKLVASAKTSGGSEFAIFGEKDASGQVQQVSQIDLQLGSSGQSVTIELDDQERPLRMQSGDGSDATFAYDQDANTVRAEVETGSGTTVDEAGGVLSDTSIVPAGARLRATKPSHQDLCDRFQSSLEVFAEFFDCGDGSQDGNCDGALADAAAAMKEFCANDFEEVDTLSTSLDSRPQDILLGIKPFFTTRPAAGDGTTALLSAVVFGGKRPIDQVAWSFLNGPDVVSIENLPGGTGVADIATPGTYTFVVEVIDASGASAETELVVDTEGSIEIDVLANPAFPKPGDEVRFTVNDSGRATAAPRRLALHWIFGDGGTAEGSVVMHTFDREGEFIVTVVASSEDGLRAKGSVIVGVGKDMDCDQICFDQAERQYLDCLLAGDAEEDCADSARDTIESCFERDCGHELDCNDLCHGIGRKAFEECIARGGSERDCKQVSLEAVDRCFEEQCGSPQDCEDLCRSNSEAVLNDCLDAGGAREDCGRLAEQADRECRDLDCGRNRSCEDECVGKADRIFEECRRDGGNEEECGARARNFVAECMRRACDGPADCEGLCDEQAQRIFDECVADGASTDDCGFRADRFFENCREQHCQDANDCEDRCQREAEFALRGCLDHGGTDEECFDRAGDALDECFDRFCDDGCDGPDCHEPCDRPDCDDAPSCEDRCKRAVDELFGDCLNDGSCGQDADRFFQDCIRKDCGRPDDCGQICHDEAQRAMDRCLSNGFSESDCTADAFQTFEDCLAHECDEMSDCAMDCHDQAEGTYNDCQANDLPVQDCTGQALDTLEGCLRGDCGDGQNPPDGQDGCRGFCHNDAAEAFDACLADGFSQENCTDRAFGQFEDCVSRECDRTSDCPDPCHDDARRVFGDCLSFGGSPDDCTGQALDALDRCLSLDCPDDGNHDGGDDGDNQDDCEAQCQSEADRAFDDCIADGLSEDDCRARSAEQFDSCLIESCHR